MKRIPQSVATSAAKVFPGCSDLWPGQLTLVDWIWGRRGLRAVKTCRLRLVAARHLEFEVLEVFMILGIVLQNMRKEKQLLSHMPREFSDCRVPKTKEIIMPR